MIRSNIQAISGLFCICALGLHTKSSISVYGFMTVRLGDWSMWVFKDDWEIIMVTYCSETNTSEPAFTTIINLSEKKKKLIVQQKQGRTCKH